MTGKVAHNSGWSIGENDPQLGDTIAFPMALTAEPRGPEEYAISDDIDAYVDEQPDLTLRLVDPSHTQSDAPACCAFCSPPGAIAERGVYEPDYALVAPDGETIVYTCHACIADADIIETDT